MTKPEPRENYQKIEPIQPKKPPHTIPYYLRIPWWVSVLLAIMSYYSLKYLAPQLQFTSKTLQNLATAAPGLAPIAAVVFLLLAAFRLYDTNDDQSTEESDEHNSKE
jgi:hypothetical protein